jgi:translation initiation factor 5
MPLLETRYEGKGIGIKTNLINLFGIAKALDVPLIYIVKFLGTDIGTDTKIKSQTQHSVGLISLVFI